MPLPLYFNGKFYDGGLNGVHRVADRLVRECDRQLAQVPVRRRPKAYLLTSCSAEWVPQLQVIERVDTRQTNQFWEQMILPHAARDGVLVNLANLAPILHRRKVTLIHDAQFCFSDCGYPLRQRLGYRWLAPRIAASDCVTLTVSDYSRRMLKLFGIADHERVRVLPNGADHILEAAPDTALRGQLGLEKLSYVVMFGSSKPYKNNRVVFDAFADPRLAQIPLLVVGPERQELVDRGLDPPPQAHFIGKISDGTLRDVLENALALAFPSRTEGFGLPPLEAMLCRCPVIASPAGAIPEACGDASIYAGVDDPQAWCEGILSLRNDSQLRRHKICAGAERAGRYTWHESGQRLYALLESLSGEAV